MTAQPAPRRWRTLAVVIGTLVVAVGALAVLIASGVIWPGRIFAAGYDVRGVDVSSYQGEIDWPVLADEDIEFAYIKATEGSSYVDSRFADNWEAAADTPLLTGAYHFLSYESDGADQAAHIIDTVPADGTLPVAVDVECYAEFCDEPPAPELVAEILDPLLAELRAHYGVAPVIYATADYYDRYIADSYDDSPIWIRSVVTPPALSDGRDWAIWQYSHRDRLDGYDGDEPFIDMNAVNGSLDELAVRR